MGSGTRTLMLVEEGTGRLVGLPFAAGEVVAYSAPCPGKTRPNEDAAAVIPTGDDRGFLAVADGLGGQPMAEQASGQALRTLEVWAGRVAQGERSPRDAVLSALEEANTRILEQAPGAGTTIAAVEVHDQVVRPFHVGDSIVLVCSARGRVRLETVPHSPIGYALAAGLIDEEDALHHPDRHIISNVVGSRQMRVEVGAPLTLEPGDTLLIASDGVTDNLRAAELIELVRGGSLRRAGEALAETCRGRMQAADGEEPSKPDDLTFLLYRGL